ncbi:MAG: DUF4349 domain-containing protein [Oligoflexia bacterium]|nr:DUF4349 domain-containing protein [Oligoflexia bacterium]
MRTSPLTLLALPALLFSACSRQSATPPEQVLFAREAAVGGSGMDETPTEAGPSAALTPTSPAIAVQTRLVRTGELSLAVEDYEPFHAALQTWLGEQGGTISDETLVRGEGVVSRAQLTLRVPTDRLDALVGWTEEQVRVERMSLQSQDVTEDWVDTAARIANGKLEEQRLQVLLARSGRLADVLATERELSRVRGEVERAEGRMRVLNDRATLDLDVRVDSPYQPVVASPFLDDAGRTLARSLAAMSSLSRQAALAAIALIPWLAVPLFLFLGLVVRRRIVASSARSPLS